MTNAPVSGSSGALTTHRYNATGTAVISPCGRYRYTLTRQISQPIRWIKRVLFIMLNPSIADATSDDATIVRCMGFAEAWGCTELTVVNLFAHRATDPRDLVKASLGGVDVVGPDNAAHITEQLERHQYGHIVAAFGAHPLAGRRALQMPEVMARCSALKISKNGWPCHPLYLKADLRPMPWALPVSVRSGRSV